MEVFPDKFSLLIIQLFLINNMCIMLCKLMEKACIDLFKFFVMGKNNFMNSLKGSFWIVSKYFF